MPITQVVARLQHEHRGFAAGHARRHQVVAHREVMDDAGVVHQYEEVLAGEAMPDGPVMLSWHDVQQARNLVDRFGTPA